MTFYTTHLQTEIIGQSAERYLGFPGGYSMHTCTTQRKGDKNSRVVGAEHQTANVGYLWERGKEEGKKKKEREEKGFRNTKWNFYLI